MKERYRRILDYVTGYMLEHGYSPTTRVIADGIRVKSSSTVFDGLRDMREAGLLNYMDECPRTITVPGYRYMKMEEGKGHGRTGTQHSGNRKDSRADAGMV